MTFQPGIHPQSRVGGPPESRDHQGPNHQPAIAPSACVCAFATVDAGTKTPTQVGMGAVVMQHAHIGHDALIGAYAEISTGAVIGGFARIGAMARIGINATILPHRRIGPHAVVGAGAVVTKDVPHGAVVAGNPARIIGWNDDEPRPAHTDRPLEARTLADDRG